MTDKHMLLASGVLGLIGVGAGAFGAHGLRERLSDDMMRVFQTGVLYHLLHAVILAVTAALAGRFASAYLSAAAWLFIVGIVLFSGSLYFLALAEAKLVGVITPIGGLCLMGGWACLIAAATRAP